MHATAVLAAGLTLALTPTLGFAQNGGNLRGVDAGATLRAANTARSGRTRPPSRNAEPATTGSVGGSQSKGDLDGLSTKGICIGCGAK